MKHKLLSKPTRLQDLSFDELDDIDTVEIKEQQMETRRHREFRHTYA